jgi:sugar phosphate isomerase/epimerase
MDSGSTTGRVTRSAASSGNSDSEKSDEDIQDYLLNLAQEIGQAAAQDHPGKGETEAGPPLASDAMTWVSIEGSNESD